MSILVTGSAGFIGFHVTKKLLEMGEEVIGIDNMSDYFVPPFKLKEERNKVLERKNYIFYNIDISDQIALKNIFSNHKITEVINLAARAGVRYSIEYPEQYIKSNIVGFGNILECCKIYRIKHLIYASSSSVYGANTKIPFSTKDSVDHPVSLYAATKKANELMAHTYAELFDLPCTGLRFFTVYGPWGRPDMAAFIFTKNIIEGKEIEVFNNGLMFRDFTFIKDIVDGICKVREHIPTRYMYRKNNEDVDNSAAPYKIYNMGNDDCIKLEHFIEVLEEIIGKKAIKKYMPSQKGDVLRTYADISNTTFEVGYSPKTSVYQGLTAFVDWYWQHYGRHK